MSKLKNVLVILLSAVGFLANQYVFWEILKADEENCLEKYKEHPQYSA